MEITNNFIQKPLILRVKTTLLALTWISLAIIAYFF